MTKLERWGRCAKTIWNYFDTSEVADNLAMILNYVEILEVTDNFIMIWNYVKTLNSLLICIKMGCAVIIWNYVL